MTGHKKEIRPGFWRLRVSAGRDPITGKYRYLSKTVEGGPRIANQALAELVASGRKVRSAITPERLIEEFLRAGEILGLELRTIAGYREIARNHVIPTLGDKRIETLTGRDLDNLYRSILEKWLSATRARYGHALLSRALGQAVKWGWLEKNVAKMASTANRQAQCGISSDTGGAGTDSDRCLTAEPSTCGSVRALRSHRSETRRSISTQVV